MENSDPFDEMERGGQLPRNPFSSGIMDILMVIALVIVLGTIGSMLARYIAESSGNDLETLLSTLTDNNTLQSRNLVRYANLVIHLFTFTLPCLILALYLRKNKWFEYLSLDKKIDGRTALLSCLVILLAMPFTNLVYWINMQIPLPDWATLMEEDATDMINALLTMEGPGELLINLVIIALAPAIGEELLFRGIFQKVLSKALRREHLAIWITAFLFSAMHMQFEGFLPRFLLGGMLGYLFSWSGSLWLPVLAHFFFNGIQVVAKYFIGDMIDGLDAGSVMEPQWIAGIISLILTIILAVYLKRSLTETET